jgi:nucleoside-diphosphate-sugar epimerase
VPINEAHPLQGQSPYSASKIGADMMAEAFARSFEVPVAILRPFNTFGPRQSERAVIPSVLRQALDPRSATIQIGDTSPSRDFTYVTDTAAAFFEMGRAESIEYGRAYNAGSGTAVTIGQLIEMGVQRGRKTKKDLKIGICGEHGGDPRSIEFCHKVGMNYVSCSPFRVPIARLAAAQAVIAENSSKKSKKK